MSLLGILRRDYSGSDPGSRVSHRPRLVPRSRLRLSAGPAGCHADSPSPTSGIAIFAPGCHQVVPRRRGLAVDPVTSNPDPRRHGFRHRSAVRIPAVYLSARFPVPGPVAADMEIVVRTAHVLDGEDARPI